MDSPRARFVWNLSSEVDRIVHTASQIANNFYQKEHIAVLSGIPELNISAAIFPDLNFDDIHGFWKKVKVYEDQIPTLVNNDLKEGINNRITSIKIDPGLLKEKKVYWQRRENRFWEIIYNLLPSAIDLVADVEIRITNFGTKVSWSLLKNTRNQKLTIYLRKDVSADHIAEAIITAFLRLPGWVDKYSWRESEIVVDALMRETIFSKMFPDFEPTIPSFNKDINKYKNQSNAYLAKLGYPAKRT